MRKKCLCGIVWTQDGPSPTMIYNLNQAGCCMYITCMRHSTASLLPQIMACTYGTKSLPGVLFDLSLFNKQLSCPMKFLWRHCKASGMVVTHLVGGNPGPETERCSGGQHGAKITNGDAPTDNMAPNYKRWCSRGQHGTKITNGNFTYIFFSIHVGLFPQFSYWRLFLRM